MCSTVHEFTINFHLKCTSSVLYESVHKFILYIYKFDVKEEAKLYTSHIYIIRTFNM